MTILLESLVRVSVVVLVALAAAALMRNRSAAVRHWILALGLVAAMAMPALQAIAPRWGMPRPAVNALAGGLIAPTAPTGQRQPVALASQTFTVAQLAD